MLLKSRLLLSKAGINILQEQENIFTSSTLVLNSAFTYSCHYYIVGGKKIWRGKETQTKSFQEAIFPDN